MRVTLLARLGLLSSLCARAASPVAQPDWSQDRFLLGEWSCAMTRPGKLPDHERVVYSLGLSGQWLKLSFTLKPHDPALPSRDTEAYETFDSRLKKWVYFYFCSDGVHGVSYSDGWKGSQKIYEPGQDEKGKWRLVTTRVSDREFTESIQTATDGGALTESAFLRCGRIP